ncbi:hypothetical protein MY11210_008084 [Beauveria gryllotalpidicola]
MKFQIIAIAATAVSTILGAAGQQRDGTCRFRVGFAHGQMATRRNSCDECRYVMNDHCYPSGLPFSLCIHTNENMKDGFLDYGANHVDFHDDGCKTESYAGPSGDGTFQDCEIPC